MTVIMNVIGYPGLSTVNGTGIVKPSLLQGGMVFNIGHFVKCLPNKVSEQACEV